MFISITWAKNWLYVPMSFNRDFKSLEYYLNKNNNDVTQTNDKDGFYEETKKVMERECAFQTNFGDFNRMQGIRTQTNHFPLKYKY